MIAKHEIMYFLETSAKDSDGRAALHRASKDRHLELVKYLVEECHCNPETKDYDGCH